MRGLLGVIFAIGIAVVPQEAWAERRDDIIGVPAVYRARESDTLLDIARDYDLGYVEIRAANPGVDPWLPVEGTQIVLPMWHILPDAPRRGLVINLPELRIYYFPTGGSPVSFPIGIGGEGKETPVGRTRVAAKRTHPVWIPTASEHAEEPDLPAFVGPGDDNPMGDYALYLAWPGYAIHGTNKPYSIGRRDSHGCIRLYPGDIEQLYRAVTAGTPVTVVDQPAKVGWFGSELYLEIHPSQADADALEQHGAPRTNEPVDADALVRRAAGMEAARIDWSVVHLAARRRDGVPVQITHFVGD